MACLDGVYGLRDIPEPPALEIWQPGFSEWEIKLAFAPTTLSIVTGHPGHGKTILSTQVWYQIARDNCLILRRWWGLARVSKLATVTLIP